MASRFTRVQASVARLMRLESECTQASFGLGRTWEGLFNLLAAADWQCHSFQTLAMFPTIKDAVK